VKHKNKIYVVIVALACSLWASDIFAIGIGVAGAVGSEKWVREYNGHNGKREVSSFGFVMDTSIAKDKLFGYRITVSRERNKTTNDIGVDLVGTAITNDFTFAIYRSSDIKLWLGPQVKVGIYDTELNYNTNIRTYGSATTFAFGPVIGINYHLEKTVTFSASFAYHISGFVTGDHNEDFFTTTANNDDGRIDADYSGNTYLNLSVLFRFGNDNYR